MIDGSIVVTRWIKFSRLNNNIINVNSRQYMPLLTGHYILTKSAIENIAVLLSCH